MITITLSGPEILELIRKDFESKGFEAVKLKEDTCSIGTKGRVSYEVIQAPTKNIGVHVRSVREQVL